MKTFLGFQKGINLGGWLSQSIETTKEYYDTFITEQDIKDIAAMGLDHVRLPVDYTMIEDEEGNAIEEGFAYIDNCIQWCKNAGLKMLLDMHNTFGYTFDPLEKGDKEIFFHSEDLQKRFYAMWDRISARYAAYNDMMAYELLNEVVSRNVVEEWNDIIEKAVAVIRKNAPETYIVFGGVCYNSVGTVPLLRQPADDHIVFTFHCYEPMIFTHQSAYWVDNMPQDLKVEYPGPVEEYAKLTKMLPPELAGSVNDKGIERFDDKFFEQIFTPALETAAKFDVPLYCGEYGVIDKADGESTVRWLKDINTVFVKYGIGRALWNYKEKDFGITDPHLADIRDEMEKYL